MNETEKREYEFEYDERQYNLMIERIHEFKEGKLYLISLIGDLGGLLDVLMLPTEEWKATFRSYWWDLEVMYAVAIDREESLLDSDNQKIIVEAVENLEKMINLKLAIYPNSSINESKWKSALTPFLIP